MLAEFVGDDGPALAWPIDVDWRAEGAEAGWGEVEGVGGWPVGGLRCGRHAGVAGADAAAPWADGAAEGGGAEAGGAAEGFGSVGTEGGSEVGPGGEECGVDCVHSRLDARERRGVGVIGEDGWRFAHKSG